MDAYLNRRQWLKTSATAVAGWIAGTGAVAAEGASLLFGQGLDSGQILRLLYNESHFGISGAARQAIMDGLGECSVYPDDRYYELKELIAAREKLRPENIILGAGSIEIITTALQVFSSEGGALSSDPTYSDFVDYAEKANCPLHLVPLTDRLGLDLPALEKQAGARIGLVYLCNPQNPTGMMTPHLELRPFCRRVSRQVLVVMDEAYHDYVEDPAYSSMVDLVREGENILVTRTFSKIYGLAGLRIGYGMARPDIIKNLLQLERNFAPVSSLSLRAAIASYKDEQFVRKVRRQNREVKSFVCRELARLGMVFIPSYTNFILFKVQEDSRELAKRLEARSVFVSPFQFQGANWIRVSLGTQEEMQAFISHLEALGITEDKASVGEKAEFTELSIRSLSC